MSFLLDTMLAPEAAPPADRHDPAAVAAARDLTIVTRVFAAPGVRALDPDALRP